MKKKSFLYIFFLVFLIGMAFDYLYLYLTPHYTPKISLVDLEPILRKPLLDAKDYNVLFEQTGLTQPIIDELRTEDDFENKLLSFQKDYLATVQCSNLYMPPVTFCQFVGPSYEEKEQAFTLAPYHNGYILFTNATHTLGWRHGHMGLVVDEIHGITLEALKPGTASCLQNIHKWEYYPTFKMMRLKNTSFVLLDEISKYALAHLKGLPYNILGTKSEPIPQNTHCSLLIWQAFIHFGYDLDSNGGYFVSPKDITCSPLLELLQIYGLNPNED